MKIFFIGEIYYSALCLESILDEGIQVDEVFITRDNARGVTRLAQKVDSKLMKRKGYEHVFYWTRTQRFLGQMLKEKGKTVRYPIPNAYFPTALIGYGRVPAAPIHKFNSFDSDLLEYFAEVKPDLVVVAGLSKKVPSEFLRIPTYGFVNCHPSLLPNYRGPSPEFQVIQNGESYSGLTIHQMDENLDTGEILAQGRFEVLEQDCVGDLEVKEGRLAGALLKRVINNIGGSGIPQTKEEGSYFRAYTEEDLLIDWSSTAQKNQRLVRAKPEGYAFTYIEGDKIYITHSRIRMTEPSVNVGVVFDVNDEGAHVRCREGSITIQNAVYSNGLKKYIRKPTFREGMVLGQK